MAVSLSKETLIVTILCFLGRLDDQFVINIVKQKLKSKPCRNQGFVLDGFPKTHEQAKELFGGKCHATFHFYRNFKHRFPSDNGCVCFPSHELRKMSLKFLDLKCHRSTIKSSQVCQKCA